MLERTAASEAAGKSDLPSRLPTRIITYAWGETYVGELLSITLPALLAPGNLPYVASVVPCELVVLTEHASFPTILSDPTVRRIQQLCRVRLVEIDDLIPARDQYGMALTYVLHRGFEDLGDSVTDTWLLFLNADFVLADGSLRNLVRRLAEGKRLVASPSYCVEAEEVIPQLLEHVDPYSRALSIPPRKMASLVLRHLHNTIRGKTVNQAAVGIRYMDQFYWRVDQTALLGHQMPIAIVGMRPERNLSEPNSYWDYGLIREYCPTTEHFVIGDSDEFLMLELRREEVLKDWILRNWPEPSEIARDLRSFLTAYQKEMVRYPLTLHSADLPTQLNDARAKLWAYIESIFAHMPTVLPSHLNHPQWEYHWSRFMEARHKYLSTRLGSATEKSEPPESLSEIDKVWWKLDGLTKYYAWRRAELDDLAEQQRSATAAILKQVEQTLEAQRAKLDEQLADDLRAIENCPQKNAIPVSRVVESGPRQATVEPPESPHGEEDPLVAPFLNNAKERILLHKELRSRKDFLARADESARAFMDNQFVQLDLEFASAREELQARYDRLLKKSPCEWATIAHVIERYGPRISVPPSNVLMRRARNLYHKYVWGMRHLIRLVDAAAANGAANVLILASNGGIAETVADHLPGLHVQVLLREVIQGRLDTTFSRCAEFDLCICNLGTADLSRFAEIVKAVAPLMRSGAKIVGFYRNLDLAPVLMNHAELRQSVLDVSQSVRIYCAGSEKLAHLARRFHWALLSGSKGRFRRLVRLAATALFVTPSVLFISRTEAADPEQKGSQLPEHYTSMTIEVDI
jgi:hypothetical protein